MARQALLLKLIFHHISIKVDWRKREGDPSLALGMTGM